MARFRLSRLAAADLAQILLTSEARWGTQVRRRYAAILAAAMRVNPCRDQVVGQFE